MRLAVVDETAHTDDREADQGSPLHGLAKALVAGRNELTRDRAAHDFVHELVAALVIRGQGLDVARNAPVLARTAGLLLVRVAELATLGNGLAVLDLGPTWNHHAVVLTFHALDVDVQVQLPHAADDGLS